MGGHAVAHGAEAGEEESGIGVGHEDTCSGVGIRHEDAGFFFWGGGRGRLICKQRNRNECPGLRDRNRYIILNEEIKIPKNSQDEMLHTYLAYFIQIHTFKYPAPSPPSDVDEFLFLFAAGHG